MFSTHKKSLIVPQRAKQLVWFMLLIFHTIYFRIIFLNLCIRFLLIGNKIFIICPNNVCIIYLFQISFYLFTRWIILKYGQWDSSDNNFFTLEQYTYLHRNTFEFDKTISNLQITPWIQMKITRHLADFHKLSVNCRPQIRHLSHENMKTIQSNCCQVQYTANFELFFQKI